MECGCNVGADCRHWRVMVIVLNYLGHIIDTDTDSIISCLLNLILENFRRKAKIRYEIVTQL